MNLMDWWKVLEENNFDFNLFGIFADWLEENSSRDEADHIMVRLISNKRYYPEHYTSSKKIGCCPHWWTQDYESPYDTREWIPASIFRNLNNYKYNGSVFKEYDTILEAYQDFVLAGSCLSQQEQIALLG